MKILVLNGSPKGKMSVTMQYVAFIQKKFQDVEFTIYHVGKNIKSIERDENQFENIIRAVNDADGLLWGFGVYMEMVPYQLKRFIELIFERNAAHAFTGKYTASISTSARWLDNLAHNYLHAICDDLEMKYCGFHSAETEDLEKEEERARLLLFAETLIDSITQKNPYSRRYPRVVCQDFEYVPGPTRKHISTKGKKILVISDCKDGDVNLRRMIDTFKSSFTEEIDEINLNDIKITGGCTACFRCAYNNHCMYENIDEYNSVLTNRIRPADILIWAGSITDRYWSSRWKLFLDRNFVFGHIPIYRDKQIGVIVSGPLGQVSTLRDPLEQGQDWHRSHLINFISDECANSETIDALLLKLAEDSVKFSESGYIKSPTFAYVGVSKLIRDELWRYQRAIMKADHKYYKEHKLYDFPKMNVMYRILGVMYSMKWFRNRLHKNRELDNILIESQQKIVEQF